MPYALCLLFMPSLYALNCLKLPYAFIGSMVLSYKLKNLCHCMLYAFIGSIVLSYKLKNLCHCMLYAFIKPDWSVALRIQNQNIKYKGCADHPKTMTPYHR